VRTLIDEFVTSISAPALKKRLFAAPYIPFRRYLGCYQVAFETGAVLGYTFRDRLSTFAKLFCVPGREEELSMAMQALARQKIAKVGETENFLVLAMFAEEARITANWRESGITDTQIDHLSQRLKMTLEQAFKNLSGAVSTGIGFGSAFPELTERLWRAAYERELTPDEWREYQRIGVISGDDVPEPLPLIKRQGQLLSLVELFVCKTLPELLPEFQVAGASF
jgi:hypothetical protein